MNARLSILVGAVGCAFSLGWVAPSPAHAVVINPVPIPAGAIQVAWRGAPVQNIRVFRGNPNQAVWLANQFNGAGWAYTFAGEMLVVPPSGRFIMADFPRANGFPWPGRMGPNSPFPGATVTILGAQLVPATYAHPPQMWLRVEIRGGNIDIIFDQFMTVTFSYNTGT
jgi:hypothetical protein